MTGNSNPIAEIIQRFGGQTALAREIGVSQGTVWEWIALRRVPFLRIQQIIKIGEGRRPPIHVEPNEFFATPKHGGEAAESDRPATGNAA